MQIVTVRITGAMVMSVKIVITAIVYILILPDLHQPVQKISMVILLPIHSQAMLLAVQFAMGQIIRGMVMQRKIAKLVMIYIRMQQIMLIHNRIISMAII